jgi:signal transduction histidine kinase
MRCPRCQHENRSDAKFCEACGTPVAPLETGAQPPRSYAEVQRSLTESLEQQAATSVILQVIGRFPDDLAPVFGTILDNALRLCDAHLGFLFLYDGDAFEMAADRGAPPNVEDVYGRFRAGSTTGLGRMLTQRRPVHIPDIRDEEAYRRGDPVRVATADLLGARTFLAIPLLKETAILGAIVVYRREVRSFTEGQISLLQTFADQAGIAIENVRLFNETKAALARQTATSDILRVISRSQTDVQPVFEAILSSAVRLLGTYAGALTQVVDNQIELAAFTRTDDAGAAALSAAFPQSLQSELPHAQAIRDRAPLNIADAQTDPRLPDAEHVRARVRGFRSRVLVPLLRHDEAIGAISVARREPGGFNADEISLLQTFADQAVIAIENVRLFTELQEKNRALTEAHAQVTEALERQTATSDILRVISNSPTDVQPVFDTVAASAARLCDAYDAAIHRLDGDVLRLVGHEGPIDPDVVLPLGQGALAGHVVRFRRVMQVADMQAETERYPISSESARRRGFRTILSVPLMRGGEAIGIITIRRTEVRPFTDTQIALLQTFADQAVIAIENVRLFKELEARTADLTRSVDQLTALGEVGRAVSSSLDLETVLTTIVSRAVQLTGVDGGVVFEYDEAAEEFELRASTGQQALDQLRRRARFRKGEGVVGRTAIAHEPVQVADITRAETYVGRLRESLIEAGVRALLAIPMLREGHLIGSLVVNRTTPGDFPPETVDLLRAFATQSALAIQNARLFREIADKSAQLEAASRHKSEFLANMSHELRTPLNAVIGFSEVLLQRMFGALNDKQDEYLKDIYASGQHLLSLINDILDLSKIEAGRMELASAPFHLPTALDNAVTLVKERAGRHGIALQLDIDPRLGEVVGDERKVKQVLLNLLSNAVKFTPEGGRISLKAGWKDGLVEIAVTDTGIGIAPEDQAAIFEEFRQVGSDETRKQEGTGLGLTLAKKFVELHGGRIWVESEPGRGSTFTFTLPVS